jgi:hypothetical protein
MQPRFGFAQDETFIQVADTHVTEPAEVNRLASQNEQILARLKRGPATNVELAGISLKYTSRISDLREAGYAIPPPERVKGGVTIYRLEPDGAREGSSSY